MTLSGDLANLPQASYSFCVLFVERYVLIDNPTEDDIDLALSEVRLRASDYPLFELKRKQTLAKDKAELLEAIQGLAKSEKALGIQMKLHNLVGEYVLTHGGHVQPIIIASIHF